MSTCHGPNATTPAPEVVTAHALHAALEPLRVELLEHYRDAATAAVDSAHSVDEGRALLEAVDLRFDPAFAAHDTVIDAYNEWAEAVEQRRPSARELEALVLRLWCAAARELGRVGVGADIIAAVPIPCADSVGESENP